MRLFGFSLALLAFSAVSSAQFLRASSYAFASTSAGNAFQTNELDWLTYSAGSTVTKTASASVGGGSAQTSFIAGFGTLKGSTRALLNTSGAGSANSQGLYGPTNHNVGAGFYDTFTLVGAGVVSLTISYTLHSINSDPSSETLVETGLKMDTFGSLGRINAPRIVHTGTGNVTTTNSFTVTGVAGQKFDLMGELGSFSAVNYSSTSSGLTIAESDAMHTASVWITPTSGSFTSLSGSSYFAPVPEPMSLLILGIGSGVLLRRRSRN